MTAEIRMTKFENRENVQITNVQMTKQMRRDGLRFEHFDIRHLSIDSNFEFRHSNLGYARDWPRGEGWRGPVHSGRPFLFRISGFGIRICGGAAPTLFVSDPSPHFPSL
jgi:hypothetical protein